MKIFGNRLMVISVPELIDYASRAKKRIRLDLCNCKELGKLVVRVTKLSATNRKEQFLGVLVDEGSIDYFVAARTISSIRSKLERLLLPIWKMLDIAQLDNDMLHLFQGGAVTQTGNPEMGLNQNLKIAY